MVCRLRALMDKDKTGRKAFLGGPTEQHIATLASTSLLPTQAAKVELQQHRLTFLVALPQFQSLPGQLHVHNVHVSGM
jgi:hypothetical protein